MPDFWLKRVVFIDISRLRPVLQRDIARYALIMFFGLTVDLSLSFALRIFFAFSIVVASASGFLFAVLVNYVLFEFYLFRTKRLSVLRLIKAYLAASAALATRVITAGLLGIIIVDSIAGDLIILIFAIAASFLMNFVVVRMLLR